MTGTKTTDELFMEAVTMIGCGNIIGLEHLLAENPNLATERLKEPGPWLREKIGNALDSFFQQPYLLWFVSEDAPIFNTLPPNIVAITELIIYKARGQQHNHLQEQLDYTLKLVCWSVPARKSGYQIELIDTLIDAGAAFESVPNDALVNRNYEAAQRLLDRGAKPTLATALVFEKWDEARLIAKGANQRQKQFCLTLCALHGITEAVRELMKMGVDINIPSPDLYSHGTPLHHAVCSGSLETVKLLVDAGADLETEDTCYKGTPMDWAAHCGFPEIAMFLNEYTKNKKSKIKN